MNDEEELRRIGQAYADAEGYGEPLVDLEQDLSDLGLRHE